MRRAPAAFALFFALFFVFIGLVDAAPPPKAFDQSINQLLTRASKAVSRLNYRGVLVYLRESQLDTLKIIHRNRDGQEAERLVSLTGQRREVIRRDGQVTSILPDNKIVLISKSQRPGLLEKVTQFSAKRMQAYYKVKAIGTRRLADRMGWLISIKPRDGYRYGYRMLIDKKTKLPLKLDLLSDGRVLEQLMFTQVSFPGQIGDAAFKPGFDVAGYRVVKHEAKDIAPARTPQDHWKATDLPPGFELADDGVRRVNSSSFVHQMLYSDGVATVSAFIAPAGLRKPLKGATTMGAVNAYGHKVDHTQITVVGEVPAVTVKQIAQGIERVSHAANP